MDGPIFGQRNMYDSYKAIQCTFQLNQQQLTVFGVDALQINA